jgi:hypothetical protein
LQDGQSKEECHSGDDCITDQGIEKTLTKQSIHESSSQHKETVREDPHCVHATAQLVSDLEGKRKWQYGNGGSRPHTDYSATFKSS